ncbi:hypothetical protein GPS55_09970, partial [Acinetobacter haemolyticus]|nr:hypothetical protein [Acinetobacter haemolyticus]
MKLELQKINEAINAISNYIDQDEWSDALLGCEVTLNALDKYDKNSIVLKLYFNLAGHFIDVGTYLKNIDAISKGIKILEKNSEYFEENFNINFFYNLANGKLSLANDCGHSNERVNFKNIELFN